MEIILYANDAELGPLPIEVVKAMLENGDVTKDDYAWFEGCENYVTVAEIPGIESLSKPDTEILAFVWPNGAKDWQGPHSLPQIQTLIARRTLEPDDFGMGRFPRRVTVAEIPGLKFRKLCWKATLTRMIKAQDPPFQPPPGVNLKKGGKKRAK